MFNDLKNENIIIEITNLVKGGIEKDADEYCQFMKEIILNTSGIN